jgi:tetratricopeptide (TPR) repeat protein
MTRTALGSARNLWFLLAIGLLCFGSPGTSAAPSAAWHHGDSPFRAVLDIVSKPNHPKAGTAISVPICGMGFEDGGDMVVFDQDGQQLPFLPLGPSADNHAIALVRVLPRSKKLYAYFGSKIRSPVHQTAFLPSLLCEARTMANTNAANWKQIKALLGDSKSLGSVFVDKIEQTVNPIDSTDPVFLVFNGYLRIPKTGSYTYMIVTDDAGYLFIDDKLVLENNGRHWARDTARGECKTELTLTAGDHKIRMVLADFGGGLTALVARWIDGKNKYVLPPKDFIQPGKTAFERVEARHRDAPNPIFWTKNVSYMDYEGAQYTEVEVGTYDEREADYLFKDGMKAEGKTVRRVLCGTHSMPVRVSRRRATAQGVVPISEVPPKAASLANADDFKRYTALILASNLADLDESTLKSYINLLEYRELNDDAIPLYEALSNKRGLGKDDLLRTLLALGRAAGRDFPEKSEKAYDLAEQAARGTKEWGTTAREYVEFLLYRMKDFGKAETLLRRMMAGAPQDKATMLRGLQLDLIVLQGKTDEAKKVQDELLGSRELGSEQRSAAVRSNALRQRYYDLMKAGFLLEARKVLHEWSDIAPVDRLHGTLPLARARYWERLGWLDGALAELDGAILMDPLLPNLPEVELERGKILQQAGDNKKANEVFLKIVNDYPNHPVAKEAKRLVK